MSNATQTFRTTAEIESPGVPLIYNVSLPTANTEVSQLLSDNTKQILIRVRERAELKYAWVATQSGTNYITVSKNSARVISGVNLVGKTIYLQSPTPGVTVEIEEWST